ncbi:MAG: hypothetical protein A4S15_14240 [Candidatus Raskinella chloraquaticus]|uniref:Probable periplasmic serine endoprotease DegP-like n=2 Tax=Candidatus Raskinella chloraquaticus TaxID=1951219 RepID=A0A1W9HPT6_9HYPH|nr:MAG: hypothetical protein A4S15_14240 [Proteobacteria bacterium SG_bin8]
MSNQNSSLLSRHRRALLGAAAALALVGGFAAGSALPVHALSTARAEAPVSIRPTGFADVVARVKPAVVAVIVQRDNVQNSSADANDIPELSPDHPLYRYFRQFRDERGQQAPRPSAAQGSGFFITNDGYLLTNNHVVEGGSAYKIITDDGQKLNGKLVGRDPRTDLALLKVDADKPLPFVNFASAQPRIGDWVVAIGNPFGLGGTVTAGILSARGRDIGAGPYDDFLQIDAPVNRGNSGGPTFNLDGDVIGINTAIYSPSGGSVGIGFAIPATLAQTVVAQLRKDGTVVRGWLGVQIQPVTDEIAASLGLSATTGALVADVQPSSPAARAGVKPGDAILAIDGEAVHDSRDLQRRVAALLPGTSYKLDIQRRGQKSTLTVNLGKLPGDQERADAPDERSPATLGSLGLTLSPATGEGKGVTIAAVDPRGVAAAKGIKAGDIILDIAGEPVAKPADVQAKLADARSNGQKSVLARIQSKGRSIFVPLPLQQG